MLEALGEFGANLLALLFVFIGLGFCIFIHELGHFIAARLCGLHVDAFALGFRPFWRKKYKGVEYRIGYLPFGGYCDIPQIDATGDAPKAADGTELPRGTPLQRIFTAFAGPFFNVLGGLFLGCFLWIFGMPQDTPKMREIVVQSISENGPEYKAGLRPGDRIVRLNGERFHVTWSGFTRKLLFSVGDVELTVRRGDQELLVRYQPQPNPNGPAELAREGVAWPFFLPRVPMEVTPVSGGAAEKAGVRKGDQIIALDGQPLTDYVTLFDVIGNGNGKPVELTLLRDGETVVVMVTPEPAEDPDLAHVYYRCGFRMKEADEGIEIVSCVPGSPADRGGLKSGDKFKSINEKVPGSMAEVQQIVQASEGKPMTFNMEREGKTILCAVTAAEIIPHTIGVQLGHTDYPTPFELLSDTLEQSWKSVRGVCISIGNRLGMTDTRSSIKPSLLSGPLGIGDVLFRTAKSSSVPYCLYFVVMISFALAVFNLLPLPVLDGGHILFGLIELVIRRPLPEKLLKALTAVFVTLLILLMVYVTFYDGKRMVQRIGRSGEVNHAAHK